MAKRNKYHRPKQADSRDESTVTVADDPDMEFKVVDDEAALQGSREPREATRRERGRKARGPMGGARQKLQANVPKGMKGRWFNDRPGRIQEALDHDYTFISDEGTETESRDGARSEIVGTHEDGSPMRAYLMAIPEEWFAEDQAKKQAQVDANEREIKQGGVRGADAKDSDSYYVPSEGISIRSD